MSNKRCAILELFWQGKRRCEIVCLLGVPKMTVSDAVQQFKELGHDGDHPGCERKHTINTSRNCKIIKKQVDRHAKISMRRIASEIEINCKSMWLMVKKELGLKPYKFQKVQLFTYGLKRKIMFTEFLLDLRLTCDALQEFLELSLELQNHNMDLYRANNKIKMLVQVFEERKQNFGLYYRCAVDAVRDLHFHGVKLHEKESRKDPVIDPSKFYTKLKESIERRLLDSKDDELVNWSRELDQKHWPKDINTQLTFGEEEIRNLSIRLQLNKREMIHGFHEYVLEKTYPEELLHLINTLNIIPISSSEYECGFLQMKQQELH
ncbi:uncharacterized protein LOC111631453 [Centruroides sculpturatus]|uniref:uncharacterized protein LOC111631453 n=1 Tax=Centruroides sculpturatus TaxID=218467 RepID=UPI000C6E07F2|nr:uncharacterized protein LOC111631453 [Centruroides sculpturatus]